MGPPPRSVMAGPLRGGAARWLSGAFSSSCLPCHPEPPPLPAACIPTHSPPRPPAEYCCNGTVVEDDELGKVLQLQGDQRKNVSAFLLANELCKKDSIKVHGF